MVCEVVFGIALGVCSNLVFLAAQWAGEMAGQQMGFTLSGLLDPHGGAQGSVLGDFYLTFALVIFLLLNGHHFLVRGLAQSFQALPLLSLHVGRGIFDLFINLLTSATVLSLQLAAPILVTMLIVDVALGLAARVMPQVNAMALAMSVRSAVGLVVLVVITAVTAKAIGSSINNWMSGLQNVWLRGAGA
jgi:flagellar biosynthetic protein FliR